MKSPSAPSVTLRNPNDLFSAQVDRVFDREERKQASQRIPTHQNIPPNVLAELSAADVSRNNSWSSVDSAVVMGETPRDVPSRHSSWGSGDNRTTPSRNSSWGSYDMRNAIISNVDPGNNRLQQHQQQPQSVQVDEKEREDVPWTISGTVKRTKQKIEEQTSSDVKRICSGDIVTSTRPKRNSAGNTRNRCSSEEVLSSTNLDSNVYRIGRLSASAPETVSVGFLSTSPAFRQSKAFGSVDEADELSQHQTQVLDTKTDNNRSISGNRHAAGMVKNLKMNFEAKVQAPATVMTQSADNNSSGSPNCTVNNKKKGRSLPSSPVHTDPNQNKSPLRESTKQQQEENTLEDINVRNLVDRYEETKMRQHTSYRNSFPSSKRNSSIDIPPSQQQPRHITRQRPMSVLETTRLNINNTTTPSSATTKPLMINHATIFLKDEPRRPPMPKSTSTGKSISILNKTNNNNNNNNNNNSSGGNQVGCKKFLQHGKTHPLARLDISKQKLNTPTPYNTM